MNRTILDYNSNINLLPVSKEQNLHRILKDVWEEVAMEIKTRDRSQPRFTYDDINSFKDSRNPPEEMLKAWKTDNITFGDLIQVLKVSKCLRAASFVENLLTVKPKSEEDQKPENENLFRIPYRIIKLWTNNFDQKNFIASGGFAKVYKGKKQSDTVAVKLFLKMDDDQTKMFVSEVDALKSCKHPNLLELLHYSDDGQPCVIYEYMENGSLYDHLCDEKRRPLFHLKTRIKVSEQTARGLSYLHSKNIVHRDIKSSNILLDKKMDAKIGDFGTARTMSTTDKSHLITHTIVGTTFYMAPEYLRQREISPRIDMYSFGVVLAELIEGLPAFDERREIQDILDILKNDGGPDANVEPKESEVFKTLRELSLLLISRDKYKRPTAQEAEEAIKDCLSKYK